MSDFCDHMDKSEPSGLLLMEFSGKEKNTEKTPRDLAQETQLDSCYMSVCIVLYIMLTSGKTPLYTVERSRMSKKQIMS